MLALEYIKFRWKLQKLQNRKIRRMAELRKEEYALIQGNCKKVEHENHISLMDFEERSFDHEIQCLHTEYLRNEADRLMIERPSKADPEGWEFDEKFMYGRFSRKTISELRLKIREEKKAKRDQLMTWIPGITGLIGTITGLFAILLK